MSISVRDARTHRGDRQWIESVYGDYLADLAPLNTGIFPVLSEIGHREPDQSTRWFADPAAHLLTVLHEQRRAGFAMVTPGAIVSAQSTATRADYRMAEFFIARPYRRRGVGRRAVRLVLDRFSGQWEIVEYLRNPGAVGFWRTVITDYTAGQYDERVTNGEVRQTFRSGSGKRPA